MFSDNRFFFVPNQASHLTKAKINTISCPFDMMQTNKNRAYRVAINKHKKLRMTNVQLRRNVVKQVPF